MYATYDESEDYERECERCEERDKQLKEMKYWLTYILEELYSRNPIEELERYLEELFHIANIAQPNKQTTLARQHRKIITSSASKAEKMCEDWLTFNNTYLKNFLPQEKQ